MFPHAALRATVELAARYVAKRYLPQKALELLDEVGAHVRATRAPTAQEMRALSLTMTQIRQQKRTAAEADAIDEALKLRRRELELEEQIETLRTTATEEADRPEATHADVVDVLAQWLGVPASQLAEEEARRRHEDRPAQTPD